LPFPWRPAKDSNAAEKDIHAEQAVLTLSANSVEKLCFWQQ
jgi:hypothetical protein